MVHDPITRASWNVILIIRIYSRSAFSLSEEIFLLGFGLFTLSAKAPLSQNPKPNCLIWAYDPTIIIHTHTHTHTHTHIYLFINIKNSGKPEMVHRYWPISEIYRTAGQTSTASGTILNSLGQPLIGFHPGPPLISLFHLSIITNHINGL